MGLSVIESGGVTTPKGYLASGVVSGLKASGAEDLALLVSEVDATVAGVFTANRFAAAPVVYDREIVGSGELVRAVVVNSGNANACTGEQGRRDVVATADFAGELLGVPGKQVLVSSTGRIGVPLPMDKIRAGVRAAVSALSADGGGAAARAIMTTDTRPKSVAVRIELDGKTVHVGGTTKGAGMIAPRLVGGVPHATMLSYLTTDAAVDSELLSGCLAKAVATSFNRITVDGDTSTNDTVLLLANGMARNATLTACGADADRFCAAVTHVAQHLAREMVLDGEGVTRFVEVNVTGAASAADAELCAAAIANSPLCKTAWFGADPNWGRILCAAGYSGAVFDPAHVNLDYEGLPVVRGGMDAGTPETELVAAIDQREFRIDLELGNGPGQHTVWTCDLTYEYVKINADYHT